MTIFTRSFDQDRLAAERGENVPIRRITGHSDRHPIARLEHRQKSQNERPG
jgi:hypothetical protein